MADFPAMPFYTDAYLADTTHLTTEEHGAYLLLLFAAWRSPGCSLRDDDAFLARVAKVTPDRWRKRLRPVLAPFWRIQDGIWTQKKQQSVREKLGAISEKRAKAARQAREAKPLAERETAPAHQAADEGHINGYPKPNTKTKESPLQSPSRGTSMCSRSSRSGGRPIRGRSAAGRRWRPTSELGLRWQLASC